MKFCQPHWDSLREKVRAAGLYPYVASSGEEVTKKMVAELQGEAAQFEPLMGAHNAILSNALDVGGFAIMGDVCPLCYLNESLGEHLKVCVDPTHDHGSGNYEHWLDHAVHDQLEYAKSLGLTIAVPTGEQT